MAATLTATQAPAPTPRSRLPIWEGRLVGPGGGTSGQKACSIQNLITAKFSTEGHYVRNSSLAFYQKGPRIRPLLGYSIFGNTCLCVSRSNLAFGVLFLFGHFFFNSLPSDPSIPYFRSSSFFVPHRGYSKSEPCGRDISSGAYFVHSVPYLPGEPGCIALPPSS